jgi:LuxR family transcriptional regulator, maltose regulon positive regulatory protein
MHKADPLIHTKLRLPFTRAELVPRPRLQEQIAQGLRGPLTLITAPAGFGKTTLVASCIAGCAFPVAWLSLDKDDNQARRFLNHLVTALQEADHTIGYEAAQLMLAPHQAPPETILTSLINDLDSAGREIALVLDDYHFIRKQAVHSAVAFLLEHQPHTFHLILISRSDPPLPLARLRAHGQMVELRGADLSFTEPEAAQFLNDVMGLCLDAELVAMIDERTEGWVAGLQMAALSMRDRKAVAEFIKGFSGTNRYILDYLLEEVLNSQSLEIQRFLLFTSILERLSAPLCDAMLAQDVRAKYEDAERSSGSAAHPLHHSASILEYVERANLFLIPLDDGRIWYRYHHLFADLLRARLDQIYPGLASPLHLRAAAWLEHAGMMVDAVNHTLAAGEYDRAAHMVEENTTHLLAQGELHALISWIEALPAQLRLARPWLSIHQAYALAFAGRAAEVLPLLAQAEATLDPTTVAGEVDDTSPSPGTDTALPVAEGGSLAGAIAAIRAMVAVMTGQDTEAIPPARRAQELLPAERLWDRAAAAWALGYALHSQGHLLEARAAFEEQVQLGRAMNNIWTLVTGLTDLAQVLRDQGKLPQARALLEEALTEAGHHGARNAGFIARTESNLAGLLYEQNELSAAKQLLSDALTHARFWPNPNHFAFTYAILARVRLAEHDLHGACTSIGEADRVSKSAALTRLNRRMVEANLVRVWLARQAAGVHLAVGNSLADQADALMAAWRVELAGSSESMDEATETAALTLARVSLAAGRSSEALPLLERVTQSARAGGQTDGVIRALVLTAIALQASPALQHRPAEQARGAGERAPALTALEHVLGLAEPGGYVRVFLDEGRPVQTLLAQWLAHAGAGSLRDYVIYLLSNFALELHNGATVQEQAASTGNLVEPLSQRELEVLHLIALGSTNQEIARQLIVSRGTIKAHTASIYRKLDVANRTEAVARARQLKILP